MAVNLYIEPLDTLFFRDSRPFGAGEQSFAETTFPSPMTIYGAVGSYFLDKAGIDLGDYINGRVKVREIGDYKESISGTGFAIKGPFISFDDEPYFFPPANLWVSGYHKTTPHWLKPYDDLRGRKWDVLNIIPLEIPPGDIEPMSGFIAADDMSTYLSYSAESEPWLAHQRYESGFFVRDTKVGHKIDENSGVVERGMLYTSSHLRFIDTAAEQLRYKKATILVVIDSMTASDFTSLVSKVGGEKRSARFRAVEATDKLVCDSEEVLAVIKQKKRFIVYLATPAIFEKGWYPSLPTEFSGAELISAAVNKPQYLSGWTRTGSGAAGIPRPIKRVAPAGSVYFFKADDWTDEQFDVMYKTYHLNRSISSEYPDAGFGICLIGVW
ncbi:MAG: type III-B CRISPR module-associated protein Cmr3 [Archaeoglobales archaeon]|nr:type III-B CRISPR module-associated protein Cmr3 [Archaeoglobales archaeon]